MTSSASNASQYGSLYIVATPIGNLEDISFRAVRILQTVGAIAAEDTRHTGKLLHHFRIKTPQISYHQHNTHTRTHELIEHLQSGQDLALVSDAGMPGISDPGVELVQACVEVGIEVIPIPGANAAISALVASGLPCDRFCFEGFLPAKGKARQQRLQKITNDSRTIVFYEAPHRLRQTLQDLAQQVDHDRQIVLARELTKRFEEFWRGSVQAAVIHYQNHEPKGEFTLVLSGAEVNQPMLTDTDLRAELQELLAQGWSKSRASRHLAEKHAMSRRQIYQLTLDLE